jgi:hypothetical protein
MFIVVQKPALRIHPRNPLECVLHSIPNLICCSPREGSIPKPGAMKAELPRKFSYAKRGKQGENMKLSKLSNPP